jgi:hypothetical protein
VADVLEQGEGEGALDLAAQRADNETDVYGGAG